MMLKTRLILFDLDNTLLHLHEYWEESMKEAFRQMTITRTMEINELYRTFKEQDELYCKLYDEGVISLWEFRRDRFIKTLEHFNTIVTEEDAIQFHELFTSLTNHYIKPSVKVERTLALLSEKYLLGIVTNGSPVFQRNKIKQMGLSRYFKDEHLFISEEVGFSKPAKEIYQLAMITFQVAANEVIFVGDSIKNDVIAPMDLGMLAIWVNNHDGSLPADVTPYAVITAIEQLERILLLIQ
jgi:HAD superfamily hydrolase (TIGR01509 family)